MEPIHQIKEYFCALLLILSLEYTLQMGNPLHPKYQIQREAGGLGQLLVAEDPVPG